VDEVLHLVDITREVYIDLQKARRLMEEAEKKVPNGDPLLDQIHRTRVDLFRYTRELDERMGYHLPPDEEEKLNPTKKGAKDEEHESQPSPQSKTPRKILRKK
jgi:hypothetical protein